MENSLRENSIQIEKDSPSPKEENPKGDPPNGTPPRGRETLKVDPFEMDLHKESSPKGGTNRSGPLMEDPPKEDPPNRSKEEMILEGDPIPKDPYSIFSETTLCSEEMIINTNPVPSVKKDFPYKGQVDLSLPLPCYSGSQTLEEVQITSDLFQSAPSYNQATRLIKPTEEGWAVLLNNPQVKIGDTLRELSGCREKMTSPNTKLNPSNCKAIILDLTGSSEYEDHPHYMRAVEALLRASIVRRRVGLRINPKSAIRGNPVIFSHQGRSMFQGHREWYLKKERVLHYTFTKKKEKKKAPKVKRRSSYPSQAQLKKAGNLGATLIIEKVNSSIFTRPKSATSFGKSTVTYYQSGQKRVFTRPRGSSAINSGFAQLDVLTAVLQSQSSSEVIALPKKGAWSAYMELTGGRTKVQHLFVCQVKRWVWTEYKGWWIGHPK